MSKSIAAPKKDKAEPITAPLTAEQRARCFARLSTSPTGNAAALVQAYSIHGELDYFQVRDHLIEACKNVREGRLGRVEAMLVSQAHSLDALFVSLARRAAKADYMGPMETYLKLALKAQSQCRATLETLATIKSPPVVIAQQANIAQGHQQVNNAPACNAIENPPNELLETGDGNERLDPATAGETGAGHPSVATVAKVHWSPNGRRQGHRSSQRR